ncbi:hypothetical protein H0H81_002605 [Sphagnurus paluster]|uniref:AB hydrolase-1 domain-containing protein n=1 Tax=Sphagnurus paluster TaxID=117069 RepID=A0A9P7KIY5_9AGAR|nr:hypothetical protein H0H81_002605 [Sphagnurus paluster]
MAEPPTWPGLPPQIQSRSLVVNDLDVHIFEANPDVTLVGPPPLLILLHGFPELAYSWRKIMIPLSNAGYYVVAPDQRGYGRTKRRGVQHTHDHYAFEDDLAPFRMLNLVTDVVALVYTLGYTSVAAVVGHDFGSRVAGHCALIRPDVFKAVVMMSAPYTGAPAMPLGGTLPEKSPIQALSEALAGLTPPRKHYTMYYSTREANTDMTNPPQGLRAFLEAYFYVKSGSWHGNQARRLGAPSAATFAKLPLYYVMNLGETMPETVAREGYAPSESELANLAWLTGEEIEVYVREYTQTGFQGGMNRYRCATDPRWTEDLKVLAGKKVEIPAMFISGSRDWGMYQIPGELERMSRETCKLMREEDVVTVERAGHWVEQEAPEVVTATLLKFLKEHRPDSLGAAQ